MPELFYDCGAYGLFALDTERWQPTHRGTLSSPEGFKPDPAVPLEDHAWKTLGPVVEALDGPHIIDVGGYIGTFTIPLALSAERHGYRLTFDTFEPGPTRHILARNIELNGLADRVRLHDAAVSRRVGKATYRWRGNGAIGGQVFAKVDTTHSRSVAKVTIDHIAKDMKGPLLIKLDTQGHEPKIMAAARKTIAAKKAVWQIEFMKWSGETKVFRWFFREPFHAMLTREFYVLSGGESISAGQMPAFLKKIDASRARMADLILVPKDAPFTDRVLEALG